MAITRHNNPAVYLFSIMLFLCFFQHSAFASLTITNDDDPLPEIYPGFIPLQQISDSADTLVPSNSIIDGSATLIIHGESLWVRCSNEWEDCTLPLPIPMSVRYGIEGQYFQILASDKIRCSNNTFGNPAGSVYKHCDYLLSGTNDFDGDGVVDSLDVFPADITESSDSDGDGVGDNSDPFPQDATDNANANWINCAYEWQDCTLPLPALVRYGTNGLYFYQDASDTIRCSNSTFGNPASWALKSCDYLLSSINDFDNDGVVDSLDAFPTDVTESADSDSDGLGDNSDPFPLDATNNIDGNWIHCAFEWQDCSVPVPAMVRYGANNVYVYQQATNNIRCSNSTFGNPVNVYKSCDYVLSTTSDFDNDGTVDSNDAFPNDPTESLDSDGDGVGDNTDPFPQDATNQANANWIHCSNEWQDCVLPTSALVRYGANDIYFYQEASAGTIRCSNNTFGNPGSSSKSCSYIAIVADDDNDSIANDIDNCPNDANTDQADIDNDNLGDVCDLINNTPTWDEFSWGEATWQ